MVPNSSKILPLITKRLKMFKIIYDIKRECKYTLFSLTTLCMNLENYTRNYVFRLIIKPSILIHTGCQETNGSELASQNCFSNKIQDIVIIVFIVIS